MSISIFNVTGPVTIGPSSSHTAGAVRIGRVARKIAGGEIKHAHITFFGSFAETYKGHGTDLAIIGGLLGLQMNDPQIKNSLQLAKKRGLTYEFETASDPRYHPNTVRIRAEGDGRKINIRASSIGGGSISLDCMNHYELDISCTLPTIIVAHKDMPGIIAASSDILADHGINIAFMKLSRSRRGGDAVVVFEVDSEVSSQTIKQLNELPQVSEIIYVPKI